MSWDSWGAPVGAPAKDETLEQESDEEVDDWENFDEHEEEKKQKEDDLKRQEEEEEASAREAARRAKEAAREAAERKKEEDERKKQEAAEEARAESLKRRELVLQKSADMDAAGGLGGSAPLKKRATVAKTTENQRQVGVDLAEHFSRRQKKASQSVYADALALAIGELKLKYEDLRKISDKLSLWTTERAKAAAAKPAVVEEPKKEKKKDKKGLDSLDAALDGRNRGAAGGRDDDDDDFM